MKVLHTADWHLGKNLDGSSRIEEQEQFCRDFVTLVEENNIDLVVIAGDVYDSINPPAKAEKLFYDTMKKLSQHGERLILVIAGNHDNAERLVAAGPLAMEHGIIMVGTPNTVVPVGEYGRHEVVASGPGFIEIALNGERAVILTVPYPSQKRLNEVLYTLGDSAQEQAVAYGEQIEQLFRNLEKHFRKDTINLAVSHLFAMRATKGAPDEVELSGSERTIELGGSYILDGSVLPLQADYIALGHVHKPQVVPGTQRKAYYSGSPLQYNIREAKTQKQCKVIEMAVGQPAQITDIPLKVYKPIEHWQVEGYEAALEKCQQHASESSWVYLDIITDTYLTEAEIKTLRKTKADLLQIKPILKRDAQMLAETPTRQIENKSFIELFEDFFIHQAKGQKPSVELLAMVEEIIQEGAKNDETN